MSTPDSFSVYLRNLPARDIEFEAIDDGRHILRITRDISLYVRPVATGDDLPADDLPSVIAGLRKLAAAAGEMADALEEKVS